MHEAVRKGVKTILAIFFLVGMIGESDHAYAIQLGTAELEAMPYLKGGTIAWDQLGGIGGHKFIIAGGLNTNVKFDPLGAGINFEKWWVAEGLDDDKGIIPKEGYSISTDIRYFIKIDDNLLLYPFAGVGFEEWEKGGKSESWKTLKFFNWAVGIGLENEKCFIRAGIAKPFSVSTQDDFEPKSRYGFSAEGGIKLKAFTVGLFYKYAGFEDPDAKMSQSGLFIGYGFR